MTPHDFLLSEKGKELLKKVQVNVPFPLLVRHLDPILAIGLQPEIFFSGSTLDDLSWRDVARVSRALDEKNRSITFHAPFMDLNPGAVDDRVREVTRFRFRQIMNLVPYFHPRAIVFHPGYDRWRYDGDVDLWLEKSLLIWQPLAQEAESLSVKLALENIFEEEPAILKKLLETLNSASVGYCLDAGHGHLFSKPPLGAWIETLGSRLFEMHLHDNHQDADEHLPVRQGNINFDSLFAVLRAQNLHPIYTIEPHLEEHLEPSLVALEKYLS